MGKQRLAIIIPCLFVLASAVHVPVSAWEIEYITAHGSSKLSSKNTVKIGGTQQQNQPSCGRNRYQLLIQDAAQDYQLSPELITAVINQESCFNANAVSPKGAQGLMQLMPGTAERFGVTAPFDPQQNIRAGSQYLRFLLDRYQGSTQLALAAYNAGEGAVDKYNGIPPYAETRNYVKRIISKLPGT